MLEKAARFATVFVLIVTVSTTHAQTRLADPILDPISVGSFEIGLEQVASGLVIPTDLESAGDGSGRLFVAELGTAAQPGGQIRIIDNGTVLDTSFLDLSDFTDSVSTFDFGLTGFAFHPGFADAGSAGFGKLYTVSAEATNSSAAHFGPNTHNHQGVIYEWQVSDADVNAVDITSRREVLRINQPRQEHNLNEVAFGHDGYLYVTLGDGGNNDANSPNAQNTQSIFGKVLRIDVDDTTGNGRYSIPDTNPFTDNTSGDLEEIFAYGLRNPYRMGFDRVTGELYVGDVGQIDIEEVNRIELGNNYGWNEKEGTFRYLGFQDGVSDDLSGLPAGFNGVDPIGQYDHDEGRSVVGGFVYRGQQMPHLVGHYVFGDFQRARLFHMDLATGLIEEFSLLPGGAGFLDRILGFGEDEAGELYVFGTVGGVAGGGIDSKVFRLVPEPGSIALLGVGCLLLHRRRVA